MNILIVDDSKAMRMIVRRTLRQAGFGKHQTFQAENGREAVQVMAKNPIDLVLSDWNMPVMNGLQLLQFLRSRKNRVRFGFVTTEGTPDMRAKAMASGAQFVIVKPFTAQTFEDTLGPLFGQASASGPQSNADVSMGTDMGGILLPDAASVVSLLGGVLARAPEAVDWRAPPLLSTPVATGIYTSQDLGQEAAVVMDVSLAACVAGAINMAPPGAVKEQLRSRQLPAELVGSIGEFFNLLARVFNAPNGRRIKLEKLSVSPEAPLTEVEAFIAQDGVHASHMMLNIQGFGRGKLTCWVKGQQS